MINKKTLPDSGSVFSSYSDFSTAFFMAPPSRAPSTPQESTSPRPTVKNMNISASGAPYAYLSTNGMMTVFASIGGISASIGCFLPMSLVPTAPIKVAILPNTTSSRIPPASRFEITHPTNSPGTAAAVKAGRMHIASDSLSWITPLDSPNIPLTKVRHTYSAAITAERVSSLAFLLVLINITP